MIKIVVSSSRPDVSIPFFMRTPEMEQILEEFRSQGKFLTEARSVSDDGLTFTYEGIFNTMEDVKEWKNNPEVQQYFKDRDDYNETNGISITTKMLDYMDD